jgi:hypothetical protein
MRTTMHSAHTMLMVRLWFFFRVLFLYAGGGSVKGETGRLLSIFK